jgi:hypothetical protein
MFLYFKYNQAERAHRGLGATIDNPYLSLTRAGGRRFEHLFTFPFEMVYHFLPWSLLVIHFFRKDIRSADPVSIILSLFNLG